MPFSTEFIAENIQISILQQRKIVKWIFTQNLETSVFLILYVIPVLWFLQIAHVVSEALDQYFPASEGVDIIAEPGRYFVASAFTLTVNIIAKRVVTKEKTNGKAKEIALK